MAVRAIRSIGWILVLGVIGMAPGLYGAPDELARDRQPPAPGVFQTEVPATTCDIILARPTRDAVTVSILAYRNLEGYLAYGTRPGTPTRQTPSRAFPTGQPVEIVLSGLQGDTQYYYRFHARVSADAPFSAGPEYTFHTQRAPGAIFTVTITADSHLDERTTPALYRQTLENALADRPDFHIDLGDTFMTEKHASRETAAMQYLAQRYYFGQLCHSAPLFLALGNHDGETAREQDGTPNSLAVWSNARRKCYFPNPVPDDFYTGNASKHALAGSLQDYYAWAWGDALFVVLDPFWFTPRQRGGDDNWMRTLGSEQYQWLKRTLEESHAKFKFVFIHHLVGGLDKDARGGAEAAFLYEWGGRNADGTDGFAAHRPGWAMPIHQLLVQNKVSAVFHGHDHLFVKQELDGIIYQEVPQPGWVGRFDSRRAVEYGYRDGVVLGSSGYLRLTVATKQATIEYVRALLPSAETSDQRNGVVAQRYTITPTQVP